jgi:hypothetical protein
MPLTWDLQNNIIFFYFFKNIFLLFMVRVRGGVRVRIFFLIEKKTAYIYSLEDIKRLPSTLACPSFSKLNDFKIRPKQS